MNTKIISNQSIDIIDQYKNFQFGNAICSIPYFNNRKQGIRAALRVEAGKGSPKDIFEELVQICFKEKIDKNQFDSESLKKFLVANDIGVDCSAFAYYILNEESIARNKGALDRHMTFPFCDGFLGKIKCKIRPIENCDVKTFAHDKNSKVINTKDIQVGDFITMTESMDDSHRDHVIVVYQIEYQNFSPTILHYIHSVAWPTDGEYNHGIHEGTIEIVDVNKPITDQIWNENNTRNDGNYTLARAKKSLTNIRRFNWF
jgi:hypothetical protein